MIIPFLVIQLKANHNGIPTFLDYNDGQKSGSINDGKYHIIASKLDFCLNKSLAADQEALEQHLRKVQVAMAKI